MVNMYLLILAVIFLIVSVFLSKILFGKISSPLGIYAFLWTGIIVTYFSGLFRYPPMSEDTIFMVFGSYGSFILGCMLAGLMCGLSRGKQRFSLQELDKRQAFRIRKVLSVFSIMGLILSINYLMITISNIGISTFLGQLVERTVMIRKTLIDDAVSSGRTGVVTALPLIFIYASSVLLGQYLAYEKKAVKNLYIIAASIIIYSIAEMSRARILDVVALFLVSYYLFSSHFVSDTKKRGMLIFRSKKLIAATLILFVAVILMGVIQNKHAGELAIANSSLNAVVTHGLYRLSIGLASFDSISAIYDGAYFLGDATLNVFMRVLYSLNIIESYNRVVFYEENPVSGWVGYNTPTYLMWLFVDFGMAGVVIIPSLFGYFLSFLYLEMRKSPSVVNISIMSLLYLSILVSFGTWRFWDMYYIGAIVLIFSIYPYLTNYRLQERRREIIRSANSVIDAKG